MLVEVRKLKQTSDFWDHLISVLKFWCRVFNADNLDIAYMNQIVQHMLVVVLFLILLLP